MIVEKYIKNLLYEHDCVVIPELGGFIAHYVSATVHPIRHTFLPPSKEIAFNEMLKLNDGLLISHLANGENVDREEATRMVSEFVNYIKDEIRRNQKYIFDEIGILSLNIEQKLQFEAFNRVNYLTESFGLPELVNRPVERAPSLGRIRVKDRPAVPQTITAPVTEENSDQEDGPVVFRQVATKKRNSPWMALIVAAVVVSFGSGYFLLGNGNDQLSSLNPFASMEEKISNEDSLLNTQPYTVLNSAEPETEVLPTEEPSGSVANEATGFSEPAENTVAKEAAVEEPKHTKVISVHHTNPEKPAEPVAKPVEKEIVKAEAAKKENPATVLTAPTGMQRYYVIVGGFGVEKNAFKLKRQLGKKGYTHAVVIRPANQGLHKVSAADFENPAEASAKAQELKAEYGSAVWVLKF